MLQEFCDALLYGLGILSFKRDWIVKSNREAGNGFADIVFWLRKKNSGGNEIIGKK